MPKRNWNEEHTAPKRGLHHAQKAERGEIRPAIPRKLLAGIECDLPELGQCLPNKYEGSHDLDRKQEQIDAGFSRLVVRVHPGDDIRSINASLRLTRDGLSLME